MKCIFSRVFVFCTINSFNGIAVSYFHFQVHVYNYSPFLISFPMRGGCNGKNWRFLYVFWRFFVRISRRQGHFLYPTRGPFIYYFTFNFPKVIKFLELKKASLLFINICPRLKEVFYSIEKPLIWTSLLEKIQFVAFTASIILPKYLATLCYAK